MPKIKQTSVSFAADSGDRKLSAASDDSDVENVPPVMIYFGSQSGMLSHRISCVCSLVGTAEAFSGIINKELQTAGIPSRVEDLDKFTYEVFKYELHIQV